MLSFLLLANSFLAQSNEFNKLLETKSRYYANIAAATNCPNQVIETWECKYYCKGDKDDIIVRENKRMETKMYIRVDKMQKAIVLSFRATKNINNFITDTSFFPIPTTWMNPAYLVHSGFLLALEVLAKEYVPILQDLMKKNPKFNIVCTGHSLGGALSTISVLHLNHKLKVSWDKLELYTYGQPRVGNKLLADHMNKNIIMAARYVNRRDLVPHLPANSLLGFTHHHNEIWNDLKNTTYFGKRETDEDPKGSYSIDDYEISDHHFAWDVQFGLNC